MAENQYISPDQIEFMKKMKAIAADLWGGGEKRPLAAADSEDGAVPAAAEETKNKPESAPKTAETPANVLSLENLWKTADESIDWTDALAWDNPPDGLTSPVLWRFYHQHAQRVLAGDVQAYAEVLKAANPVGELTDFTGNITLRAPGAERLEASFECREELLRSRGRNYMAAVGLRMARDLLACLPVSEVEVRAEREGKILMQTVYPRSALLHRNFLFLNPAELAEECGAQWNLG